MANIKKKGLGKGLGALLGDKNAALKEPVPVSAAPSYDNNTLPDGTRLLYLDPTAIKANPKQPRRVFDEEALQELSESIRHDGVMEPVIVREHNGEYELVSGERRVRASIMADLNEVPAVCRKVSDRDMLKLGIIENIQREDLNAIEIARGYHDLIEEFGWTQEQLSEEVGKKRVTVTNTLRLLNLPEVVQEMVADGSLTMGHAKALLSIEDTNAQLKTARKIIAQGLSVRQTEKLATETKPGAAKKTAPKDPNIGLIEDNLRRNLGTKVAIKHGKNGRGRIEIEYFNTEEFDRLLSVLNNGS